MSPLPAAWFRPSVDSLLHLRRQEPGAPRASHWFPWLMLVWSIWIFITPFIDPRAFPHWRAPTFASYAVFLWLFWRVHYRDRAQILWSALAIAALGFALTPLNPGGQGYLIYACAYLAFCAPRRCSRCSRCIRWNGCCSAGRRCTCSTR